MAGLSAALRPLLAAALVALASCVIPSVAPAQPANRDLDRFPGLARIFRDIASRTAPGPEREAAAHFDFEQVVRAIAGTPAGPAAFSWEDYRGALSGRGRVAIAVTAGAASRDDTAYRLHSLGYSPKEIADILSGRITRSALDNAQKMLMLGSPASAVSDFLDREYTRLAAARERADAASRKRPAPGARPGQPLSPSAIDAHVVRAAAAHGVDAALVRAVIAVESAWNPEALSRVGAVGLMQLMPGTARELGVDARDPRQNVEGGTRYLAGLLRAFKTVELALVAYNAGPGFAERFVRGQVALYGETREFVANVMGRLGK